MSVSSETPSAPGPFVASVEPVSLTRHLIAILIFVGFPALWTMALPVSWVRFERQAGVVSASARVCLFFVVPYRHVALADVREVTTSSVDPTPASGRLSTTAASEYFLVLTGASERTATIPVAESSAESLRARVQAYLEDSQASELSFFVPSNWGLAVFGGGVLSLLTVFYVFNAVDLFIHRRRMRSKAPAAT